MHHYKVKTGYVMRELNIEHRTSNIQLRTLNGRMEAEAEAERDQGCHRARQNFAEGGETIGFVTLSVLVVRVFVETVIQEVRLVEFWM